MEIGVLFASNAKLVNLDRYYFILLLLVLRHRRRLLLPARPDMTFAVDWALKTNYLSIYLSSSVLKNQSKQIIV